jgi:hypothetical protein
MSGIIEHINGRRQHVVPQYVMQHATPIEARKKPILRLDRPQDGCACLQDGTAEYSRHKQAVEAWTVRIHVM